MTDLSPLRQRLGHLSEEIRSLVGAFTDRSPFWRGLVYRLRRRCGKSTCRCARGDLHVSTVLADRSAGPQRIVSLGPDEIGLFRRLTEDYRLFRKARARLNRHLREMLSIIDRIESERLELGRTRVRESPSSSRRRLEAKATPSSRSPEESLARVTKRAKKRSPRKR